MDSMDQEQERGITIMSKVTSLKWGEAKLNIVDTPGHADFGGEVERVLGMVDGVCLLVDATEGPMPQTKFVLTKALAQGLRPLVVLNKVDRDTCRVSAVEDEIFDLFVSLDATDEQLDFDFIYASAKEGWAVADLDQDARTDMGPLLDAVVRRVPPPAMEEGPFRMLVAMMEHDPYVGRMLTGRVASGQIAVGDKIHGLNAGKEGSMESGRVTKLYSRDGMQRVEVERVYAGDICTVAGLSLPTVANTLADISVTEAIEAQPIDPPTISMTFSVNDSPLAGKSGNKLTSQKIKQRLWTETENNVSIQLKDSTGSDSIDVLGRGEMQLGILIETMRREGFELSVAPPKVVFQHDENGKRLEPVENVTTEVDDDFTGQVIEELQNRKGDLLEMGPTTEGRTKMVWRVPSRGMIGYRSLFATKTRGTGILYSSFEAYMPHLGELPALSRGAIVATAQGTATTYQLGKLEPRGCLFVADGDPIYEGLVIGEHSRDSELTANPCQKKQLTNIRTQSTDENIRLTPPRLFSLEEAISYVGQDELVEVTPLAIRLRKKHLGATQRKTAARSG